MGDDPAAGKYTAAEQQVGTEPPIDGHSADIFEDGPANPVPGRRWLSSDLRETYDNQEDESARVEAEEAEVYPLGERRKISPVTEPLIASRADKTDNPDVRGTRRVHPPE